MNAIVIEKVSTARDCFMIDKYPGNYFDLITQEDNYIKKYNMILLKEDIGKLSGFIGYADNGMAIICINYNRPICHQNFTLAHEIGHRFLHEGKSISDSYRQFLSSTGIEKEANDFASELLYPMKIFERDYNEIMVRDLLSPSKRIDLAIAINTLCLKYCVSFEMVLRKILFKAYIGKDYKKIRNEIEKLIGNVSNYFDSNFYKVDNNHSYYQKHLLPYTKLKNNVEELVTENRISYATGESILYRNDLLED
jgi:Zn-dependent peptidase ImmA (M78 family)